MNLLQITALSAVAFSVLLGQLDISDKWSDGIISFNFSSVLPFLITQSGLENVSPVAKDESARKSYDNRKWLHISLLLLLFVVSFVGGYELRRWRVGLTNKVSDGARKPEATNDQ
jgi:hypothetical protein